MDNPEKACVERNIVTPRWLPGSDSIFWYRRVVCPDTAFSFIYVNCETGICQLAFDHNELAASLSEQTSAEVNPSNLPFTWINLDGGCAHVRFQFQDITWQFSQDGKLEEWHGGFDDGRGDKGCEHAASPWSFEAVDLTFNNQTSRNINVHWIDNNGNTTGPQTIRTNRSKKFSSWLGHRWRVAIAGSNADNYTICELTERRCVASIYDSPNGLTLQWEMDAPVEKTESRSMDDHQVIPVVFVRAHNLWLRYPTRRCR